MRSRYLALTQQYRDQGLYRQRQVMSETTISFSHNDYLGLSQHPYVKEAAVSALKKYGVGARASVMMQGYTALHQAFEEALAQWLQVDKAFLLSAGYSSNVGVIASISQPLHMILLDRLVHASLIDGARLASKSFKRYRHLDVAHLAQLLEARRRKNEICLIVTESVFSMDGDIAPLSAIAQLASQHQALCIVDDAHGFGVIGATGKGGMEHSGLSQRELPVVIIPMGKAVGVGGCVVAGDADFIDYLAQFTRSYMYSTALSPALVGAALASLRLIQIGEQRKRLQSNIQYFKLCAAQAGLPLLPSDTPIQPLMVGEVDRAMSISARLLEAGIVVRAIRAPTVPRHSERLRISLSSSHTKAQIERLVTTLFHLMPEKYDDFKCKSKNCARI